MGLIDISHLFVTGKGRAGSVVEKIQPSQFKQSNSVIVETVTKSESSSKVQSISNAMHHASDSSKVVVKGPGLDKAYQNKQNTFNVNASNAGMFSSGELFSCDVATCTVNKSSRCILPNQ